jgi:hypothetical protein
MMQSFEASRALGWNPGKPLRQRPHIYFKGGYWWCGRDAPPSLGNTPLEAYERYLRFGRTK